MPVRNKGRKPRNPRTKPFFPHDSGYWAAKIGGRTVYLARWSTPLPEVEKAYERRREQAEAEARQDAAAAVQASGYQLTIKDAANLFLNHRATDVERGELSPTTWAGYKRSLDWVVGRIGTRAVASLRPQDFTNLNALLAEAYGAKQHEHVVGVLRMAFGWAVDNDYLDRPPKYGTVFRGPGRRQHRRERAGKAQKLFTAPQLRALVDKADDPMKAMVLLGLNCGYLQSDLSDLPIRFDDGTRNALRLDGNDPYVRFDRPKTGVRRKCTLWPETVEALNKVIGGRTEGPVFSTRRGRPLVHTNKLYHADGRLKKATNCDAVVKPFRELCQAAGCYTEGVGFSALRSTFETRAWHLPDLSVAHQAAIHWVMGHTLGGPDTPKMADTYLQDISTDALRLVTDKVRDWYLHAK